MYSGHTCIKLPTGSYEVTGTVLAEQSAQDWPALPRPF